MHALALYVVIQKKKNLCTYVASKSFDRCITFLVHEESMLDQLRAVGNSK